MEFNFPMEYNRKSIFYVNLSGHRYLQEIQINETKKDSSTGKTSHSNSFKIYVEYAASGNYEYAKQP